MIATHINEFKPRSSKSQPRPLSAMLVAGALAVVAAACLVLLAPIVWTAGKAYGQPDFIDRGCGFGREATLFLLNQGVRVTGTNGWSWDAPFSFTAKRFKETGDASLIWEGHKAGREIGYCHMEKLSNLDALPSSGFKVACFPVKIEKASAGWTRAVAIVED